ncbi:hypothetical protein FIBSPDRAFT_866596 [Athelia psychrophila]|uniref:Uncharacterized protein n=1 Tax=Athelia psychrophila TaxID=1759441 RepID=A0A166ELJ2_9AGAM|nr:hypothetical protein FIBSPDRAFT_866596 [Fibularhizoctonia sp. CBS 109695]
MALQLPSPPETLTESLAKSQSTFGSSTEYDASTSKLGGRFDAQFPSTLGPGRVPPHRRGTSKTYERMEDLLRETGYKETRVFTPETERAEAEAEKRKERTLRRAASVRSGVDAVVGFISGLVSRAPSVVADGRVRRPVDASGSTTVAVPQQEYSPPPSPLANKRVVLLPRYTRILTVLAFLAQSEHVDRES